MTVRDIIEKLNENGLLDLILTDRTTEKEIIWATDNYARLGDGYGREDEITAKMLTKPGFALKSRADKAAAEQSERTKTHAEVFTPFEIVKKMTDYIDAGEIEKINSFSGAEREKALENYIDTRYLEITCGEAPFLVSRYDAATGEPIPIEKRVGVLDRKLRAVSEISQNDEARWKIWAKRAFRATYGYEYQGDSLLIARINLLMTYAEYYVDYMEEKFQKKLTPDECEDIEDIEDIIKIITWNIWQMDGLTGKTPGTEPPKEDPLKGLDKLPEGEIFSIPEDKGPKECVIKAWKKDSDSLEGTVLVFNKLQEKKSVWDINT